MKTVIALLTLLILLSPNIFAQEHSQFSLPEGAKARLGKGWTTGVAYSPDGTRLAVASIIGIWLYDTRTGVEVDLLSGQQGFYSVSFSPDGKTLATGHDDRTVRLWDAVTGEHKQTLAGHTDWVYSVAFSPDGSTIASVSVDSTVRLWDAITGTHKDTLTGHRSYVHSVVFSPDGSTLASSEDNTVLLWDVETGSQNGTLTGYMTPVQSISFSPDGNTLATGNQENTIWLWDVMTGTHKEPLTGHTESITSIAFSPDGNTLASGSYREISLWDTMTSEYKQRFRGHAYWIYSIAFSPDGNTLASGSYREISLWDTMTGAYKQTLTGHTSWVTSVAFSPDGRTLASGSGDNTVRLWDAMTGVHIQALSVLTITDVEAWLTEAHQMALTDPAYLRGIAVLEQLLAALAPKETTLLPNYPNPFNPETWIPYHLAHDAEVTLTIYDTNGTMVRQLALGYQSAGYYIDRSNAVYWDGRNESGESVASGVYFYQLRAGDYVATRRMVILK